MASRSGESGLPRAISERTSIASSEGAATIAGPVMKPCAMKSRRGHGTLVALVPDGLVQTERPRGLFLRMYMLSSPLLESASCRCRERRRKSLS